jgi:hypothetical protein
MCSVETVRCSDQDVSVADSVIDGTPGVDLRRRQDLAALPHEGEEQVVSHAGYRRVGVHFLTTYVDI